MNIPVFVVECIKVSNRKKAYKVIFPYNEQLVDRIKSLPREQREWDKVNKYWEIRTWSLYQLIKSFKGSKKIHFDFGTDEDRNVFLNDITELKQKLVEKKQLKEELEKKKVEWLEKKLDLENNYLKYYDLVHKNLKPNVELYPYQIASTMFLDMTKNSLLALDMGTGKSLVSIAYCEMNEFEKVFVITPNSLKFNYYNEIEKFTNSKAHIVNWKKNLYSIEESKYIIVNYEFFNPRRTKRKSDDRFLKKWNELGIEKVNTVICDECHRLKSLKSNTYKNFKRIFKQDRFIDGKVSKIFMSGTPMKNRAHELYSVLNQISPLDFQTKSKFEEDYCGIWFDTEIREKVYDISEANFEELFRKISPYVYRKRKEEVLKDLPDKTYQKIVFELANKELKEYNKIAFDTVNLLNDNPKSNPLTIMIRLRQFLSSLKVSHCMEIIDSILETGEKVVIVDYYKESLYELKKLLGDVAGIHTGDQTVEERDEVVRKFQDKNSGLNVFLGSIQTCNYGLTLTAASKLFIITLPFSLGEYDQVADRCHRISQENAVNIYALIFKETVDENTYYSIENKRSEIMVVLDNEEYIPKTEESVLHDVIYKLKKDYGKKL